MVASDAEPTTYPLRTQTHTGNLGALTTRVLKVSGSPHLKAPRFQLLTCIVISQVHASERDPAVIAAAEKPRPLLASHSVARPRKRSWQ